MPTDAADDARTGRTTLDVLIVTYRSLEDIDACLDSLRAALAAVADRVDGRIRVLDNASPDGTAERVRTSHPDVLLDARDENLGFGAGNMALAHVSDADLVLLINPDTIVREDFLAPLLDAVERDGASIASPILRLGDGTVQRSWHAFPTLPGEVAWRVRGLDPAAADPGTAPADLAALAGRPQDFVWATCWLVRRADFLAIGGFDPRFPLYDEDLDFCRRAAVAGWRIVLVPASQITHLGGRSSDDGTRRRLATTARERYYRIHVGRPAAGLYRVLIAAAPHARRLVAGLRRG